MESAKKLFLGNIPILLLISLIILVTDCHPKKTIYTRGIGIYPGSVKEYSGPELVKGDTSYRNLAFHRPAYHSSSYDYNLTAQLVTDGIITSDTPEFINVKTSQGEVAKADRELILDHVTRSTLTIDGSDAWIQLATFGLSPLPEVTRIVLTGELAFDNKKPTGWNIELSGSDYGKNWQVLGQERGRGLPGKERPNPFAAFLKNAKKDAHGKPIDPFAGFLGPTDPNEPKPSFTFHFRMPEDIRSIEETFDFNKPVAYRFYKVNLNSPCAKTWMIGDLDFFNNGILVEMAPSFNFKSAWMSAGTGEEWVYADLGAESTFDHIRLFWINKALTGEVQVSDDARSWTGIASLPGSDNNVDDIMLGKPACGRYVRVLMKQAQGNRNYILSELQIMGRGGLIPAAKDAPMASGNRLDLTGGCWKLQRAPEINSPGDSLSMPGFKDNGWITATVPGTVLTSFLNTGAIPDPNYSDNQLMISESFFNSDFWYRDEFEVPEGFNRSHTFLNFDGINWKAEVYLNGKILGNIKGAFIRGKFDISHLLIAGKKNALAVLIQRNDHPGTVTEQTALSAGKNGGILGADNPTFHASIGWDWIPTIRGRNIGIWNDVYLTATGNITIEDPLVTTDLPLPDTTSAGIHIEATLRNHSPENMTGKLSGKFGEISFEQEVTVGAGKSQVVKLDPDLHHELNLKNPKLWWPKGYGMQNLYPVELEFQNPDGSISDQKEFVTGIREMTFNEDNQVLNLYINGRRFVGRGGNWGFPESNLNYRNREYDIAVGYHADMNFTMIRNWVGQTADDEFFEACDRYGVMVWQDFWLANPADGPDPYDPAMFIDNAKDFIKRIRNHPSIALYVGRNEGNPPAVLDTALRSMVAKLHPGIHYISNSAFGVVSGGGPYSALPPRDYYLLYGRNKLHSERGMPNVMTYESLQDMLPETKSWPQNTQWGLHDYCLESAQRAQTFNAMIDSAFGPVNDPKQFTELAQWINYDGYRAIFEGRSKYRQGVLLWMSHPAWPSMVWQTYDYYFEPDAAYFACKKACEPIHIQWNPVWDSIEVVNYSAGNMIGLKAAARIINMDGKTAWEKETNLDSHEDTTLKLFKLEFPSSLSPVHFIKLMLMKGDRVISDNFYWRGHKTGNFQALNSLPRVEIEEKTSVKKEGGQWTLKTILNNSSSTPVLMIRLKITGSPSGERILPAWYDDNYFSLMPGETRTITMQVREEDTRGEKPAVVISAFNLKNEIK